MDVSKKMITRISESSRYMDDIDDKKNLRVVFSYLDGLGAEVLEISKSQIKYLFNWLKKI